MSAEISFNDFDFSKTVKSFHDGDVVKIEDGFSFQAAEKPAWPSLRRCSECLSRFVFLYRRHSACGGRVRQVGSGWQKTTRYECQRCVDLQTSLEAAKKI